MKRFGLHCMVASNELQVDYFGETAKLLFELVVELNKALGIKFEFVNLVLPSHQIISILIVVTQGGGVGIPYRPGQDRIHFSELSAVINKQYPL